MKGGATRGGCDVRRAQGGVRWAWGCWGGGGVVGVVYSIYFIPQMRSPKNLLNPDREALVWREAAGAL